MATEVEGKNAEGSPGWLKRASLDLFKILAGIAALGALLLHLVGSVWHQSYLTAWNVDPSLFSKSTDWLVILGFQLSVLGSVQLWSKLLASAAYLVLLSLGISLYWFALSRASSYIDQMDTLPGWALRMPTWLRQVLMRFLLVVGVLFWIPLAIWLLGYLSAVPIALAHTAAKEHAKVEIEQFSKGCGTAPMSKCFDLLIGTNAVGQGFLIDGSKEYLAFFDVGAKRVRVVQRAGTEVRWTNPR